MSKSVVELFPGGEGDEEAFCAEQAGAIRLLGRRMVADVIEIGERLLAVQNKRPGEQFERWLDVEFGWSRGTAFKFMQAATAFVAIDGPPDRRSTVTIDASAIYLLSAPKVPREVREEAIERAERGEHITKAEAERMVAERVAETVRRMREEYDAAAEAEDQPERHAPTLDDAIAMMCELTGRKKLAAHQVQSLAHALGRAIAYGDTLYQPISDEDARKAEGRIKLTSEALRALGFFGAEAMPPREFVKIAPDYVRAKFATLVPKARAWLDECADALEG